MDCVFANNLSVFDYLKELADVHGMGVSDPVSGRYDWMNVHVVVSLAGRVHIHS